MRIWARPSFLGADPLSLQEEKFSINVIILFFLHIIVCLMFNSGIIMVLLAVWNAFSSSTDFANIN